MVPSTTCVGRHCPLPLSVCLNHHALLLLPDFGELRTCTSPQVVHPLDVVGDAHEPHLVLGLPVPVGPPLWPLELVLAQCTGLHRPFPRSHTCCSSISSFPQLVDKRLVLVGRHHHRHLGADLLDLALTLAHVSFSVDHPR